MKKVILAIVIVAAASACTVRSERTVVERPTPAPADRRGRDRSAAVHYLRPGSLAVVLTAPAPPGARCR